MLPPVLFLDLSLKCAFEIADASHFEAQNCGRIFDAEHLFE